MRIIEDHFEFDSEEKLESRIESYFRSYPHFGYDTRIIKKGYDKRNGGDVYSVVLTRQSSCD